MLKRTKGAKMSKKSLFTLSEMVLSELEQRPETRDSDMMLVYSVYRDYYGVRPGEAFFDVIMRDDLPQIESIGRCRRKWQEEREDLRGTKRTQEARLSEQEVYLEYSQMTLDEFMGA